MALETVKNFLSRHVSRRIDVKFHAPEISKLPEIKSKRDKVNTYSLEAHSKIETIKPLDFKTELNCNVNGFKFKQEVLKVRGGFIKLYTKYDFKTHEIPKMKPARPKNSLRQIMAVPQERMNRIKWQKLRPRIAPGEMVIAWYGPIVESAVLKLVLNKQAGTLLIWYDSRSRKFSTRGLFLCRKGLKKFLRRIILK